MFGYVPLHRLHHEESHEKPVKGVRKCHSNSKSQTSKPKSTVGSATETLGSWGVGSGTGSGTSSADVLVTSTVSLKI